MSGGPVFDESGNLVGIICGSLESEEETEEVSYVAAIWPMLRILIDGKRVGQAPPPAKYPAIDLALDGVLSVVDMGSLSPQWFPGRDLPS